MFFFVKQKTAYEMRISDWSSDVCSSDLDEFASWRTFHLVAVEQFLVEHEQRNGFSRHDIDKGFFLANPIFPHSPRRHEEICLRKIHDHAGKVEISDRFREDFVGGRQHLPLYR